MHQLQKLNRRVMIYHLLCLCGGVQSRGSVKPIFLLCHHTYCFTCVKGNSNKLISVFQVLVSFIILYSSDREWLVVQPLRSLVCLAVCVLHGKGHESLWTIVNVLENIQLKNAFKNQKYIKLICAWHFTIFLKITTETYWSFSCWSFNCEALPKQTSIGQHTILDQMDDAVEEINGIWSHSDFCYTLFSQAIEKKQEIEGHLQTALADNSQCLERLRSLAKKIDSFCVQNWDIVC